MLRRRLLGADFAGGQAALAPDGGKISVEEVGVRKLGLGRTALGVQDAASGRQGGVGFDHGIIHDVEVQGGEVAAGRQGLAVDADHVGYSSVDLAAPVAGYQNTQKGIDAGVAADHALFHRVDVGPSSLRADRSGLRVRSDDVAFTNIGVEGLAAGYRNRSSGRSGHVAADRLGVHEVGVRDATFDANRQGLAATASEVDFTNVAAENLRADYTAAGGARTAASVDSLGVHDVAVRDASFRMGRDGLHARAGAVDFVNTRAEGLAASRTNEASGRTTSLRADELAVHDLAVRDGSFDLDGGGLRAGAGGVDYTHVGLRNAAFEHANARTGNGVRASVDSAALHQVHVGSGQLAIDPAAMSASASLQDASYTGIDVRGGALGIQRGGRSVLDARADVHASHSVDSADASIDLGRGRAEASVAGYRQRAAVKNVSLNVLGTDIDVPDVVLEAAASGSAGIDLSKGAAHFGLNLAGSQLQVGESSWQLSEMAQAGVEVDLAGGQLNLNVAGKLIDVDEAVGRFVRTLKGLFGGGREAVDAAKVDAGRKALEGLHEGVQATRAAVAAAAG